MHLAQVSLVAATDETDVPRQLRPRGDPTGEAAMQVADIERSCDPGTIRHLEALRVAVGWRCLEVSASSGGIVCWLRDRVGSAGHVTDTLEPGPFDLIHARLVLARRPERRAFLQKLVAALGPGGWILVEDADWRIMGPPAPPDVEELLLYARGAMERSGFDPCLGGRLTVMFVDAGLVEVGAAGRLLVDSATWAHRWRVVLRRLRTPIVSAGVASEAAIDDALGWLQRTQSSATLIAAWGRRLCPRYGMR